MPNYKIADAVIACFAAGMTTGCSVDITEYDHT